MNEDRTTVRNWCVTTVLPGDTFIDIGADIGEMSEAVFNLHRAKRIIAVEPQYGVYANKLEHLVGKVELVDCVVGDQNKGYVDFYVNKDNTALNSIYRRKDLETLPYKALMRTLDDIIDELKVEAPVVLKIDAEFAEHLIWKGMQKSLDKIRVMCMEFQYEAMQAMGIDGMKLLDELKAAGFTVEFINNDNIEVKRS